MVDAALLQAPGEENLTQFRVRLEEHLRQIQREELRKKRLSQAHVALKVGRYNEAIQKLESAKAEGAEDSEVLELLALARREQQALQSKVVIQETKKPVEPLDRQRLKMPLLATLGVGMMLAVVAAFWHTRHGARRIASQPHPEAISPAGVARTYLDLNASPWAVVTSVQSSAGQAVDLGGGDRTTPLRLDNVPIGRYTVAFKDADGIQQKIDCVVSAEQHLCTATFAMPEVQDALRGDQP